MTRSTSNNNWVLLFACWVLVLGATLGSLFFSEVMELPPCSLCWYQRVFMFPLPLIIFAGLFPLDVRVVRYALPLTICGAGLALYHTLLHLGIIPESATPCSQGVSCSSVHLDLFGLLSIPMLSLLVFVVATVLLLILRRSASHE